MIPATFLFFALAVPDSASPARAERESSAMFAKLWGAAEASLFALTRVRPASGAEWRAPRDSVPVDETWLTRLRAALLELPEGPSREVALVPGQSYPYLFVITLRAGGEASAVELDFRGPCARFVRHGEVVASRSFRGREEKFAALLGSALPADRDLARLRTAYYQASRARRMPAVEVTAEDPCSDTSGASNPSLGDPVYVDKFPEPITRPAPAYPDAAREAGIDGTVTVQALVGCDGMVLETIVTRSIPELDQAAIAAVKTWVFKPAMSHGRPTRVWVAVPVKFSLR